MHAELQLTISVMLQLVFSLALTDPPTIHNASLLCCSYPARCVKWPMVANQHVSQVYKYSLHHFIENQLVFQIPKECRLPSTQTHHNPPQHKSSIHHFLVISAENVFHARHHFGHRLIDISSCSEHDHTHHYPQHVDLLSSEHRCVPYAL